MIRLSHILFLSCALAAITVGMSAVVLAQVVGEDGASVKDLAAAAAVPVEESVLIAHPGGPYEGDQWTAVRFDGTGSAPYDMITEYEWDFGDGTTGTGMTVWHRYIQAGNYTVNLTVRADDLQAGNSTVVNINPAAAPLTVQPTIGTEQNGGEVCPTAPLPVALVGLCWVLRRR